MTRSRSTASEQLTLEKTEKEEKNSFEKNMERNIESKVVSSFFCTKKNISQVSLPFDIHTFSEKLTIFEGLNIDPETNISTCKMYNALRKMHV